MILVNCTVAEVPLLPALFLPVPFEPDTGCLVVCQPLNYNYGKFQFIVAILCRIRGLGICLEGLNKQLRVEVTECNWLQLSS